MRNISIALMAGVLIAGVASAQQAPAPTPPGPDACDPANLPALPPALAGWSAMAPVAAGGATRGAPTLVVGRGASATLVPTAQLTLAATPAKPPRAGTRGGLFGFAVTQGGRYRVALGGPAWLDVLSAGKPVASIAHAHGPTCSGIRKMVDFDLKPGSYVLQVVDSADATLPMLVVRVPA